MHSKHSHTPLERPPLLAREGETFINRSRSRCPPRRPGCSTTQNSLLLLKTPPWIQPRGKWMVSLDNSHTNTTRIGWNMWEIGLRIAPGLPLGRGPCLNHGCDRRRRPTLREAVHSSRNRGPAERSCRTTSSKSGPRFRPSPSREREFFSDNLLVRIHYLQSQGRGSTPPPHPLFLPF